MNEIDAEVVLRDCYRCRICNNKAGANLIVIKTNEEEYVKDNLLTLCQSCKNRFEDIGSCDPEAFVIEARERIY